MKMAMIAGLATAVPEHVLEQEEAQTFASQHFGWPEREAKRMSSVFTHAGVHRRYLGAPLAWLTTHHSFAERNARYQEVASALARAASQAALVDAGMSADDISALIFVSSTGIATPSLDTNLITDLGMRPNVKRMPLWGLGCAGGAAGLARAADWADVHEGGSVLLVCVELCSLTFIASDQSKRNLIGAALFGDGAAAVIVCGESSSKCRSRRLVATVMGSHSHLFPDSRDIMGWDVREEGLGVIFSRDIPSLVEREMAGQIKQLLEENSLTRDDLDLFIAHPGGAKVLTAYQRALACPPDWLTDAAGVLADYGNMSSPTVLFVLARTLAHSSDEHPHPRNAALAALGPGFCCEQVLLRLTANSYTNCIV